MKLSLWLCAVVAVTTAAAAEPYWLQAPMHVMQKRVYSLCAQRQLTDVQELRDLLKAGAAPDAHTSFVFHFTPLMRASDHGHADAVAALLEYGADPNARNEYGSTPLIKAGRGGHTSVMSALLKHGADPNSRDVFGKSALMKAGAGGHVQAVNVLLEAGADRDATDMFGFPAAIPTATAGEQPAGEL